MLFMCATYSQTKLRDEEMKKLIVVLYFLVCGAFLSCSKDNSPTNVNQQQSLTLRDTVALLNYSFEKNSSGSIEGWRLSDTLDRKYISFSNDVATNGGNYSLAIQPDSAKLVYLNYTIIPPSSVFTKRFRYSFDSKILYPDSLITYMSVSFYTPTGMVPGINAVGIIKADQWRTVENVTDTISAAIDSIIIGISVTSKNKNSKYYYDNVRIIEEEYN
jgi:hypothetical protein